MRIEQAIYGNPDAGGYRFLARSPGFADGWLPAAQDLCAGFGDRPAGVSCPLALFARPFPGRQVAVVQVADQGTDDAGRPGALAFRLLVLPGRLYADLGGDPFLIADAFPPVWDARDEVPSLEWTAGPPPHRTIDEVRKVLDVVADRTATLLGGAQILVDGGRLVFERKTPDAQIVRDLWRLLPTSTRTELWPATFAFGNRHGFHVVVTPTAEGPEFEHHVREQAAGDYPEGAYEYALHKAADDSDQRELDGLFARRSRNQTFRLGVILLLAFLIIPPLVLNLPFREGGQQPGEKQEIEPKGAAPLKLPAAEEFPALSPAERTQLAGLLTTLARKLGAKPPTGTSEQALRQAVVELDQRIDAKRGDKTRLRRDPGKLDELGPVQRGLRGLLWKQGVAEYAEPGLNLVELVERLEKNLARDKLITEENGD